jgi:uncharacterized spore protein YtfJ
MDVLAINRFRILFSLCSAQLARAAVMSAIVAAVAAGCSSGSAATSTGGSTSGRGAGRGRGSGVQPVVMAKVVQKDVPVDIAAIGNVEAYITISIRSQVTGQIEQAFFQAKHLHVQSYHVQDGDSLRDETRHRRGRLDACRSRQFRIPR